MEFPRAARADDQLSRPGRAAAQRSRAPSPIRSTSACPVGRCYPMVGLATAATVIASQAVISGAYSATRQAIQLGYLPRMDDPAHLARDDRADLHPVDQLAADAGHDRHGARFGSSTALATAYGVSVTGTMLITSILLIVAMRHRASMPHAVFWPLAALFVLVDVAFLSANLVKFMDGAWFPLAARHRRVHPAAHLGARSSAADRRRFAKDGVALDDFLPGLMLAPPARVPGTAVFLTAQTGICAQGPAAQPQAQQGAARAQRAADGGDAGQSRTWRRTNACNRARSATTSTGRPSATDSWRRLTCRWR